MGTAIKTMPTYFYNNRVIISVAITHRIFATSIFTPIAILILNMRFLLMLRLKPA